MRQRQVAGAERTLGKVAGPREVADCGTNRAGSATASRPVAPHSHIDKLRGTAGKGNRPRNPGLQLREIKPQTSD